MLLTEIQQRALCTSLCVPGATRHSSGTAALPPALGFAAGETQRSILHLVGSKNAINATPTCHALMAPRSMRHMGQDPNSHLDLEDRALPSSVRAAIR